MEEAEWQVGRAGSGPILVSVFSQMRGGPPGPGKEAD